MLKLRRTPEKKPTSPVQIVSKSAPQPPHSAPPADSASPTSAPKLGDSFTEHRYPPLLKVPAIKEDEDSPIDNGLVLYKADYLYYCSSEVLKPKISVLVVCSLISQVLYIA